MKRKLLLKFLVAVVGLVVMNEVYRFFFFKKDLYQHTPMTIQLDVARDKADVVYFGESSNYSYAESDSDKRSISEFTASFFPGVKFMAIDTGAVHAGIYKRWLNYMGSKCNPQVIIVTLNLRSFNASWIHSELETALQKSVVLLEERPALLNRFFLSLKAFDSKSAKEREQDFLNQWKKDPIEFPFPFRFKTVRQWDSTIGTDGVRNEKGEWDSKKTDLTAHYVKSYAFTLRENNPRIQDFDEIVKWCKSANKKLVLNLLSENLEYADSLVGKELCWLMKNNRDFLVKRYSKMGAMVVDNLTSVKGSDFIDQNWTTEHYVECGRKQVAKTLADSLRLFLRDKYKSAY
jgi:hypothetical protein